MAVRVLHVVGYSLIALCAIMMVLDIGSVVKVPSQIFYGVSGAAALTIAGAARPIKWPILGGLILVFLAGLFVMF